MLEHLRNHVALLEYARNHFAHFVLDANGLSEIGQKCVVATLTERWRQDDDQMIATFAKKCSFGVMGEGVAAQHVFDAADLPDEKKKIILCRRDKRREKVSLLWPSECLKVLLKNTSIVF